MADGRSRNLSVPEVPAPQLLAGPWEVEFAPGWGVAERVTFAQLGDWTEHPDEAIRHYSGKATYRKTFILPPASGARLNARRLLDLGQVRDLAVVRVNGQELGTLWLAPHQVDITHVTRPGENTLEVEIVNVWNNRLVGDAALPADRRRTLLLAPTVNANSPLLSAGLLGPVAVRYAVEAQVP